MIRLHSTKLLSGVSAVAVLAALSATPAHAAQTFTGPGLFAPYVNTAVTDNITVTTDAVMNSDGVLAPEDGNSIINEIAMSGAGDKIDIIDSVLVGGILNSSTILSSDAIGININTDSVIVGSINNAGLIQGATTGIVIDDSVIVHGLFNGIGATITGANAIIIQNDSVFIGGIFNEGAITGSAGDGIRLTGANVDFVGGITNFAGGAITGTGTNAAAIDIGFPAAISSFVGNVTNDGTIQGLGGGSGIFVSTTGGFTGDIINNSAALIAGTGAAAFGINIAGGTFTGNITNSGQVLATGTTGVGINIGGTSVFIGNVTNNSGGVIHAASTALGISGTSFTGNVSNSGLIQSDSGTAIAVSTPAFTGDITNNASGSISASVDGVNITSTAFTGNFTNHGAITGSSTGVNVGAATFTGNVSNSSTGAITGGDTGLKLSGAAFNGNVQNDGDITGGDGIHVNTGSTLTGALTNTGTVTGDTSDGIDIEGVVTGAVTNTGLIDAQDSGIEVEATVGGINNSGTIIGAQAIDLRLATGATTITQTAGSMQGDLRLDQTGAEFDDIFNADGGELRGNTFGGGGDDMAVAGNFNYVEGTADGLDQVNVNSGTAVFGSTGVGTDGAGVTFTNTNALTVAGGTAYLDDNTTIGLNNDLTVASGATLAYFLTSDTATHGQINATGNANLDGTLLAVVDGSSFGSIGGDTFTYDDIITGTVSGTFANVATSSLFFEANAVYNAGDVDLQLLRLNFGDVLTLGALTRNQAAVGGALETIYGGGTYGSDFEDLFNYLLSLPAGSEGEVAAIYDNLGGAEHAQVQQAVLRASAPFDMAIGERFDESKLSLRGTGWAQNGERRYADAAQQRAMSDAAPASAGGNSGLLRGSSGVSIWGRGYGDWTDVDGDVEAPGYKQDAVGVVGGVDVAIGENALVGGAFGWGTSSLDFDTPRDRADINSFEFGGYGSYGFGRFYADAQLSFAFHDVNTTRELDLGFDTFIAGATYNARAWTLAGEVGTVFKLGKLNMQPMVGVNYTGASTNGFIEAGAGDFGLVVADADADSLTSTIGLRMSAMWTVGGTKLVPDASIAWRHEFADDRQSFTAAFLEDPSTPFNIISSAISPDSALVNAGLTAAVTQGLELFVDYNGVINSDANSHNGSAGFRATW